VLVDPATGAARTPVTATQLRAAVRRLKRVELPPAALLLPAPLATLGEHSVSLRFDAPGRHALAVVLKKRL